MSTLLKISIKKGFLRLVKTAEPLPEPTPVKRIRALAVLVTSDFMNLRPMQDQTLSEKDRKGNYSGTPTTVRLGDWTEI